jgi:starch synthase (maltosyl-transferring)
VLPAVDNGRFAVKCVAGERVRVRAHCFTDGHDVLRVQLCWRAQEQPEFREVPMKPLGNDVWEAAFSPPALGRYVYTAVAWVDPFESWRSEMTRRVDPDDVRIASQVGALEIAAAAARAEGADKTALQRWASELDAVAATPGADAVALKALALDEELADTARRHPDRRREARYPVELPLVADRERARFSTWYELFPRSAGTEPGVHGTFKDVEARLPAIAAMGFDVLYFPPIHPIGRVQRKGPNNKLVSGPEDVGSPWAIGAAEGGHKDILPALGTPEDFRQLVARAAEHGLEIALDIAFQCAPDHPYVKAHPDWFRWRPDGSVQYAENPPKKYQDIYPFNFESEDWRGLWSELKSVFDHWVGEGVRIFRVDNPHTKAFPFWDWVIAEIKRTHPEVIFLAEAFTRPKVMHRLAKGGFSQSYTYFTWRNSKQELTEYFTELSSAPGIDYFRPNVWPNTPDILHEQLQGGEAPVFMSRLVLAATLAASYGIYGPAYELDGAPAARPRQRGIPRLREVPAAPLGPRRPREPRALHRAGEPHPPREPRAAVGPHAALLAHRQPAAHGLRQDFGRRRQRGGDGGQPRSAQRAGGLGGPGARERGGQPGVARLPDARPAQRPTLHLAGRRALRAARSAQRARPYLRGAAAPWRRARLRLLSLRARP